MSKNAFGVHMSDQGNQKKYWIVYEDLRVRITEGKLQPGQRLPPERQLVEEFAVSRPTVTRALNDLAAEGYIQRRGRSGSYVSISLKGDTERHLTFGLLVPGLGKGEIFEPICARIASRSERDNFTVNWGHSGTFNADKGRSEIVRTAQRYVERGVDGVFFEPVELHPDAIEANREVIETLAESNTPVVLLDGDYLAFPERSRYDIVGIDNIRAAYVATKHLIDQGAARVDFLWRPFTATTYQRRLTGYRAALTEVGIGANRDWEHAIDTDDAGSVRELVQGGATDIVCVNDESAAILMRVLEKLDLHVPSDVRVVGFDDVKYARLARVPLTTIKQPCDAIGDLAIQGMLSRLKNPEQPPRDLLLEGVLTIRASSQRGSHDRQQG